MMGIRENKVELYLRDQVRLLGGDTRKWVSPGRDGVPDQICFVFNGLILSVEVKCVDGRLSTAQHNEHKRLRSVGMTVTTVYGSTGVDDLINHLLRLHHVHQSDRFKILNHIRQEYRRILLEKKTC